METRNYTAEQEAEMLRREESHHFLDFKRAIITPGKLQETVTALANADGGEIIIGLDDDIRRSPIDRFHGFPKVITYPQHLP
ncbi:MAG TPA: ATP-binding protein, partial [Candidatus Binatia bacterium]|nr:ATP-binding protein [Candidatus Binatia bacterium]